MRRRATLVLVFVYVFSAFSTFFITQPSKATTNSIWSDKITLSSDDLWDVTDTSDDQCKRGDISLQMYSSGGLFGDKALERFISKYEAGLSTKNTCLVQNDLGLFGDNYWSPDGNPANATEIKNVTILPAPARKAVIFNTTYGSDPYGSFRSSINYNLPGIGKLQIGSRGRGLFSTVYKQWLVTTQAEQLSYADGSPMVIRKWAFSKNGRFAVVSLTTGVLARINLQTREITPFTQMSNRAKNWQLTISNDGNYVLSYDKNASGLTFSDLTGCQTKYAKGGLPNSSADLTGCTNKSLQTDIVQLHPEVLGGSIGRMSFGLNSASFIIGAGWREGNDYLWRKLTFVPENYVSRAQGYLAMGDSFSSGEGDTQGDIWYEKGTDEQGDTDTFLGRNLCHLSRRSYPYLMAIELGYLANNTTSPPADSLFRSVACSGAKIQNIIGIIGEKQDSGSASDFAITDNQFRYGKDFPLKDWQPGSTKQLSFVEGSYLPDGDTRSEMAPEVITLGIGGNDVGFGDYIRACATLLTGTCEFAQTGSYESTNFITRIAQNKSRLVKTFNQVKAAAPESRIYVHGYPKFIEGTGGDCSFNVKLDDKERLFTEKVTHYMNEVIKAATAEAGVFYVDVEDIFAGHKLCSPTSDENIFVNGVTVGNDIKPLEGNPWLVGIGLTNGACLRACLGSESYHPRSKGHEMYRDAILSQTNNLQASMPDPKTPLIPVPEPFFGLDSILAVNKMNDNGGYPEINLVLDEDMIEDINFFSNTMTINLNGFLPNSTVELIVRSDPTSLGEYQVNADGNLNINLTLPQSIGPGYHEVHAVGLDKFGNPIDSSQSMLLGYSPDDFDGDGVLNDLDSCQGIENSGVDEDNDQIDDACDIVIQTQEEVIDENGNNLEKGQVSPETVAGTNEIFGAVLGVNTDSSPVVLGVNTLQNTGDKLVLLAIITGLFVSGSTLAVSRKRKKSGVLLKK